MQSYKIGMTNKIIIIANRLPIIIELDKEGSIEVKMSAGGLATAMSGIQDWNVMWIGWPGSEYPKECKPANRLTRHRATSDKRRTGKTELFPGFSGRQNYQSLLQ